MYSYTDTDQAQMMYYSNQLSQIPSNPFLQLHSSSIPLASPIHSPTLINHVSEQSSFCSPTTTEFFHNYQRRPIPNPAQESTSINHNLNTQSLSNPIIHASTHKSKWTIDEDQKLQNAVEKYGTGSWIRISRFVPGRNSKQCRERWMGQLSPTIRKESWTIEEDEILMKQHKLMGNKWTAIATLLPGRSAINVKNRWSKIQRIHDDIIPHTTPRTNESLYKSSYHTRSSSTLSQTVSEHLPVYDSHVVMNVPNPPLYSNNVSPTNELCTSNKAETPETDVIEIKPKNRVLFELPTLENSPFFGDAFAQFQAQMLKE